MSEYKAMEYLSRIPGYTLVVDTEGVKLYEKSIVNYTDEEGYIRWGIGDVLIHKLDRPLVEV